MKGAKEYFLMMREEGYFDLPQHLRERVEVRYNDYHLYKDDEQFKGLYKNYREAKKKLNEFKFKRRHNL